MAGRRLKAELKALLQQDDWHERLQAQLRGDSGGSESPAKSCLGPLFSFLLLDGVIRWRAAMAVGMAVARLCEDKSAGGIEAARDILRRLMWNLNEESGNVAWGAPEAMAECLVQHQKLAEEFHNILISYIDDTIDHGLWLELPLLRRGAVWGVARLCCARPELMARAGAPLLAALQDTEDAEIPGLAAWGLGCLGLQEARPALEALAASTAPVALALDGVMTQTTVGVLAHQALAALERS
ncbi:DVU0298 family protein [Megalodesulfovibrio paquesii]